MARLKDKYTAEVIPALKQKFGYKNINEVPRLEKVVLNMGLGECKDNPKSCLLYTSGTHDACGSCGAR